MDRRTTKRTVGIPEFLCLCIALGDEEVSGEAWNELNRLSRRDAEVILQDLETAQGKDADPAHEAAQLFLKDRIWKRAA